MLKENDLKDTPVKGIFHDINIRSFIGVFFYIVLIIFILKAFVVEFYRVESGSMEPELYKNDIVIVSRVGYFFGFPTRFPVLGIRTGINLRLNYRSPLLGDIVVIDETLAGNIKENKLIIKRVVGIPGDKVFLNTGMFTKRYHLSRNSVNPNEQNYLIPKENDSVIINSENLFFYESVLLNEGDKGIELINRIKNNISYTKSHKFRYSYYFVQGDNVNNSHDSRAFGLIPDKSIIGRAVITLISGTKKRFFRLI